MEKKKKNFLYLVCDYSCQSCSGPKNTDCITCAANRGENITRLPINQICGCPPGFYDYIKPECEGYNLF